MTTCPTCRQKQCICADIPAITSQHRLILLVHVDEWKKPTNTGRWATLALKNSAVVVRGTQPPQALPTLKKALVLYPSETSVALSAMAEPVDLVVPDGNWRQAAKMPRREPALKDVPQVHLPVAPPTALRLRKEHTPHGMATLEAIALAFGLLDGEETQRALLGVYELAAKRILAASRR